MNVIRRSDIDDSPGEIVWADGELFVSPMEERLLKAVENSTVTFAHPAEPVIAELITPIGAYASFVAAFPNSYWLPEGEDFPSEPDNPDAVY